MFSILNLDYIGQQKFHSLFFYHQNEGDWYTYKFQKGRGLGFTTNKTSIFVVGQWNIKAKNLDGWLDMRTDTN